MVQQSTVRKALIAIKGSSGVPLDLDAEAISRISEKWAEELSSGRYQPKAVRYVRISKPDGSIRPLLIPNWKDRVCQRAILIELWPTIVNFLVQEVAYCSHRKTSKIEGRGIPGLVGQISNWKMNQKWIVTGDIASFYSNIPRVDVLTRLSQLAIQPTLLSAIHRSLHAPIENASFFGRFPEHAYVACGLFQGSPLSPVLASFYISDADREAQGRSTLGRYVDDIVVAGLSEQEALDFLAAYGRSLSRISPSLRLGDKGHLVPPHQTVSFLGLDFTSTGLVKIGSRRFASLKAKLIDCQDAYSGAQRFLKVSQLMNGWIRSVNDCSVTEGEWLRICSLATTALKKAKIQVISDGESVLIADGGRSNCVIKKKIAKIEEFSEIEADSMMDLDH